MDANHTLPNSQYTPNSIKKMKIQMHNDIIPRDINREGDDFMKWTTFSESFSKPWCLSCILFQK